MKFGKNIQTTVE